MHDIGLRHDGLRLRHGPSWTRTCADAPLNNAMCAAIFRTKLTEVANTIVQPYGVPVSAIVQAISNLRAKLSMANDDQVHR